MRATMTEIRVKERDIFHHVPTDNKTNEHSIFVVYYLFLY
jgi:hypothetical protein